MSEREDSSRGRPLVIAPALLAALLVLSTDAAAAAPPTTAPWRRDILSPAQLGAIGHLAASRIVRAAASYPATGVVPCRDAPTPPESRATICLIRESLLALPPPAR